MILAAVDGEAVPDRVVSVGHDLAGAYGEELLVLHVMEQERFDERRSATSERTSRAVFAPGVSYGGSGDDAPGPSDRYNIEDGQRDAERVASDVVRETLETRTDVSCLGRVGDPADEIVAEADRRDARYLVIGGRRRSPVGKALFGSVTQSVLLNADRPVVTVREP